MRLDKTTEKGEHDARSPCSPTTGQPPTEEQKQQGAAALKAKAAAAAAAKEEAAKLEADKKGEGWSRMRARSVAVDQFEDWMELNDPTTNRVFYYNRKTGVSQWTRPQAL